MRLLLTLGFSVWFSSTAYACSCVSGGGCPGLGSKAHRVFLGTIVAVTDLPSTDHPAFLTSRKAHIQVDESFGGLSPEVREVDVLTGSGGGDCGVPFRTSDVYLIDALVGDDGLMHAGICSWTRRIDRADAALRVLRQRRAGQPVPSLVGQVAQYDRNFDGLLGMHAPRPLGNTLVRLRADGRQYETVSDAEGLYAFYNLPPGQYEFAPDLPPGTTLSWFIGSDKPLAPLELHGSACQERNIEVFSSGSIQGRVLDSSNRLVPDAFAYIVPADQKALPKKGQLYWEFQGKEGFFKFVHVPPGEYVIVVNPDDALNPSFPYRRTFYPGVRDREAASIITLRGGEQIKNADIRLLEQFSTRHLTVHVTWSDGRLIKDFVSVHANGTDNPTAMAYTKQPDLKVSLVDLKVLANESYKIEAEVICRYADERSMGPGATLHSNQVYLGPKDDLTELSLVISATSCPEVSGKTLLTDR